MNWVFFNPEAKHTASDRQFRSLRQIILERPSFYEILVNTERLFLYWFTVEGRREFCGYVREDMLQ